MSRATILAGILAVACALAMPFASAWGVPFYDAVDDEARALAPLLPAPVAEVPTSAPDAFAAAEDAFAHETREDEVSHETPPPAEHTRPNDHASAHRGGDDSQTRATLIGRGGLVPIPVIGEGALPRLDLGALAQTTTSALGPVLPQEDASDASAISAASATAPAPTARESSSASGLPLIAPEAAVIAAAAAASAAAPSLPFTWDRIRRFAPLAALYSRIARERLLDHGSRDRLLAYVKERPGSAVTDLARGLDLPRNTITYHLRVLEREGLLRSTRNGRHRLFWAAGALGRGDRADAIAALRHDTSRRMVQAIADKPGLDQQALCHRFGLAASLVHWHADRLVTAGVVEKRRDGRRVRYYPGETFQTVASLLQ